MQLKDGKAARPDDIPAETLKVDMETLVEMLPTLCEDLGENEVPTELKKGYTMKLPEMETSVCVQTSVE